ncbi:MAG TPA: TolC family protein [Longimicrobiaceae bacterium]|nr:TolC family protein [Longimicrobiaceae bacterium]
MATRTILALAAGALLCAPAALVSQSAGVLTLPEVYALADTANPMLRAARSRAEAVGAMQRSASLPPDPQVQLGVMNASLPGLRTDMPNSMAPSIQVMQMVPLPGKLGLAGRIAARETERAEAEAAETAWMVRGRAAMAFYEIYQAERQLAVMRETVRLLKTLQAVARSMYGAGTGRQADVLRAGVEVARMDADVARMQAMRAAAAARLNAVLGRPAETPVPAVAFPALPLELPPADTLRAWAEATRPLLARGRIGAAQADDRARLAGRELWPDLTVGLQYGQRGDAEMGTERMGSLMVGFSIPVFARRRQLRMRDEAAAMREMADAELDDARVQVDARITELLAELERARALVRLYRGEVLPQAEAAVRSSLSSYRVGAVDFMALVDAQMTVNRSRQELDALRADYGLAVAELEMAVGREIPRGTRTLEEDR